jgi:hypothetical protein
MTAISGRRRRVANDKSRDRRRLDHGLAAQLIGARRLPIGLAMVARRPIDCPPYPMWRRVLGVKDQAADKSREAYQI